MLWGAKLRTSISKKSLNIFWARNRETVIGYILMICVFSLYIKAQPNFFSAYGIKSTFDQSLTLLYAGLAQTFVILIGGTDLSIGSMIALTNSLAVVIMIPLANFFGNDLGGILGAIMIVMMVGALAGFINGLLVVYGRLQPIIVTLATSFIYTGIGMYLVPKPGGTVVSGYSQLITGSVSVIPKSFIWLVVAIVIIWIPIRRSKFGQAIYAIGGNEYSAFTSGINIKKTKLKVFLLSGLFCSMAGLFLTAFTGSGDPTKCDSFTLNSIAAVVLGGTSLAGGRGGFIGTIAGVITFSLILGLLVFWKVPTFYQESVKGLILIFALGVGILEKIRLNKRKCPEN